MSFGGLFLLLLTLLSSVLGNNFRYTRWSQKYLTNSKDVALSMALDDGNGFVYLVGRTESPRGMNVSFPGLLYDNAMQHGTYDASKRYRDAIITRVSKHDGRVLWAERLLLTQDSKFSAVTLSVDRLTVYAAGTAVSNADDHPFIVQAFNADTGKKKGRLFKAAGKGRHLISSLVGHAKGVYLCGRASTEIGTSLDSSRTTIGGIVVGSLSKSNSLKWLKQAGEDLDSDVCSGLSLSEDKETLFMAGTSHRKHLPGTGLGLTVVHAITAEKGQLIWTRKIQRSADTDMRSSSVLDEGDAVYVLTSLWTEHDNSRKIYLHKLSRPRGTHLWSKETCCTSILHRDPTIRDFEGKGAATPVSGMGMGADRYIYHMAYYRRKEEFVDDRYGTVVIRTGEYGGQLFDRDISLPVESFRIIPSEPKKAVISETTHGIYVLSNDMAISSEEVEESIPSLNYVTFNVSSTEVLSKPSHGPYYINITLQLHVSSVTVGAVSDVLAEKLRLSHAQIGFSTNQSLSTLSQISEANFWINLYGDDTEMSTLFKDTANELTPVFLGTGQSRKNVLERHFGISSDSVSLVDGSLQRVEMGLSATATEDESLGANAVDGTTSIDDGRRQGGFKWKVFGIAAGGLAGVALVVGGLVFLFRKRDRSDESFVASSFHGRPAAANGEVHYYPANDGSLEPHE